MNVMHAESLGHRVDMMRRGRGVVLEAGHTLIIGWSEVILSLLDQLCQGLELSGGQMVRCFFGC
jgi:hypothetical protein